MNRVGQSVQLSDAGGVIAAGQNTEVFGVLLSRTLSGSITFTGMAQSDGSAQSWTINAGSTAGRYAAPGSGKTGGNQLTYALSDVANDGGAAVISLARAN